MRFLFLMLLIGGGLIVGVTIIYRFINKIFGVFQPGRNSKDRVHDKKKEVLYEKDDVVVLKGEAGNKRDKS